jgi:O-antigen biosynthesis protein
MTTKNLVLNKIKDILSTSPPDMESLRHELNTVKAGQGLQAAHNALQRAEVSAGIRKPSLAIFDHTGHIIGGGQKYGFTVAHALQDTFDVTLLLNRTVSHQDLQDWYHLDLSKCKIKIIAIPFFDQFDSVHLDPARINRRTGNPFHAISIESGNYDFFINNSMNEKVYPMANVSALICHFPERRPKDFFYADKYTFVIYNSEYTAHWIQKKWKFSPHKHIYPPVDMAPGADSHEAAKEKIILSVARFESGGSKKQMEMVRTFLKLNRRFPDLLNGWRLVLAGGSADENDYLKSISDVIKKNTEQSGKSGTENISDKIDTKVDIKVDIKVNIPGDELKDLYRKASIFWHLCGLGQTDPALVEHFGMTIVEAMQNRLVPIVFDGGGQREIVEQGVSGFRAASTADLMSFTLKIIRDSSLQDTLSQNAYERSKSFTRDVFEANVRDFFNRQLREYREI